MYCVCLLPIVVAQDVLQNDTVTQQLTRVDKFLFIGTGFTGIDFHQVSFEPSNRPRGFAFNRLILELLVRGFHNQCDIHDATTMCGDAAVLPPAVQPVYR